MSMNDISSFLNSANQGDPTALRALMMVYKPDMPNPALMPRVAAINQLRLIAPGKFEPHPNVPDPAAPAIAEMRSLMPPQVGMLLCSVPPGRGLLCAANDTRFVFFTDVKYTVVTSRKTTSSELLVLPAGQHMLYIAAYGSEQDDPFFTEDPFQQCASMIDVVPGKVTEVVAARENNFKQLTYYTVYH